MRSSSITMTNDRRAKGPYGAKEDTFRSKIPPVGRSMGTTIGRIAPVDRPDPSWRPRLHDHWTLAVTEAFRCC